MPIPDYYVSIPIDMSGNYDYVSVHPEIARFWSGNFVLSDDILIPVTSNLIGKYLYYNIVPYPLGVEAYNKLRKGLVSYTNVSNRYNLFMPIKPPCLCIVIDNNIRYLQNFNYYNVKINDLYWNTLKAMYNLYLLMNEFIKCYIGYICLSTNSVLGISDIPELTGNSNSSAVHLNVSPLFSENTNLRTVSYNSMSNSDVINEFNLTLNKFRLLNPIDLSDPEYVVVLNNSVYGHENDSDVSLILSQLNSHISQTLPNAKIINYTNIVNQACGVIITNFSSNYSVPDRNSTYRTLTGYYCFRPWSVGLYNSLVSLP